MLFKDKVLTKFPEKQYNAYFSKLTVNYSGLTVNYSKMTVNYFRLTVYCSRLTVNYFRFTHDEGRAWYNHTISDDLVTIYGLITEPGEITSIVNVYAIVEGGMEWVIFTIDFKDFMGKSSCSHCTVYLLLTKSFVSPALVEF